MVGRYLTQVQPLTDHSSIVRFPGLSLEKRFWRTKPTTLARRGDIELASSSPSICSNAFLHGLLP